MCCALRLSNGVGSFPQCFNVTVSVLPPFPHTSIPYPLPSMSWIPPTQLVYTFGVVAATACRVSFLLDPAVARGRHSPWHMNLQCLDFVAALLHGVSYAVCTRQPPTEFTLARFHLPAWSSVRSWLLHLRAGSVFAPAPLPAPDHVWHVSDPMCRGAGADGRLGLA